MRLKRYEFDAQKAKQVAKGGSYCPCGGMQVRFIPFFTRLRLSLLLFFGVEVSEIHVDIKNSGAKEAIKFVEALRETPGMGKAFDTAMESFAEEEYSERVCTWKPGVNDRFYQTSCGEVADFIMGGPSDNKMSFCPYCGEELEVEESES